MSDASARLDLEVNLQGDQRAAKGLDDVADSSGRVSKSEKEAAGSSANLDNVLSGLTRGTKAAAAAQASFAALMRGNFVGSFRLGAVAVKELWAAMVANPFMLVAAAVGAAISGLVLWKRHVDQVKRAQDEAGRSLRGFLGELHSERGDSPLDFLSQQITSAERAGDVSALTKARDNQAKKEEELFNRARILGSSVAMGNESDRTRAEEARRTWREAKDALDLYNAAISRIAEADKPGLATPAGSSGSVGASGGTGDEWAGWRAHFKSYTREKRLSKISDPLERMQAERGMLENDLKSAVGWDVAAATKRLEIREKILDIEKRISDEIQGRDRDSKRDASSTKGGERDAAARAALNGERNLGDSFGVEVPDGFKIVDRGASRRTLAGGRASQWFAQRNKDIATASGGAFVSTEMGKPFSATTDEMKKLDLTNTLLAEVVKRLA